MQVASACLPERFGPGRRPRDVGVTDEPEHEVRRLRDGHRTTGCTRRAARTASGGLARSGAVAAAVRAAGGIAHAEAAAARLSGRARVPAHPAVGAIGLFVHARRSARGLAARAGDRASVAVTRRGPGTLGGARAVRPARRSAVVRIVVQRTGAAARVSAGVAGVPARRAAGARRRRVGGGVALAAGSADPAVVGVVVRRARRAAARAAQVVVGVAREPALAARRAGRRAPRDRGALRRAAAAVIRIVLFVHARGAAEVEAHGAARGAVERVGAGARRRAIRKRHRAGRRAASAMTGLADDGVASVVRIARANSIARRARATGERADPGRAAHVPGDVGQVRAVVPAGPAVVQIVGGVDLAAVEGAAVAIGVGALARGHAARERASAGARLRAPIGHCAARKRVGHFARLASLRAASVGGVVDGHARGGALASPGLAAGIREGARVLRRVPGRGRVLAGRLALVVVRNARVRAPIGARRGVGGPGVARELDVPVADDCIARRDESERRGRCRGERGRADRSRLPHVTTLRRGSRRRSTSGPWPPLAIRPRASRPWAP